MHKNDRWCLVICNVCICFILGLLGLGTIGPVYRLRPSNCDRSSYQNNTERWYYGNDWILFPRDGLCPLGAIESDSKNGFDSIRYTHCLKWGDQDAWREVDMNNIKSNYTWDPSSDNYSPSSSISSTVVLPYLVHANSTFESTFEEGAKMWSYLYDVLVTACVLIIIGAITASQLGYQRRPTGSLRPTTYCTEITALVFMLICILLIIIAWSLVTNTLQLNPSAWEKSFFATCEVMIWAESGYSSAFASLVICSFYLVMCFYIVVEACCMGRDGAPFKCSDRVEHARGQQRQRALARLSTREHGLLAINERMRFRNPQLIDDLPRADSEIVTVYNVDGVATTIDKALTSPPRVLSQVESNSSGNSNGSRVSMARNRRFEVVATSDVEIGLQEACRSNFFPVNGHFIDFHGEDEDAGIVTTVNGNIDVHIDHSESNRWGNFWFWSTTENRTECENQEHERNCGDGDEENYANGHHAQHSSLNVTTPDVIATYIPSRYG